MHKIVYLFHNQRKKTKFDWIMAQENETGYMLWDEWKLSKVFTKTLSELEIPIEDK